MYDRATLAIDVSRYQHADHCYLTVGGVTWRITAMNGLARVHLVSVDEEGRLHTAVADLAGTDWESYTRSALRLMELRAYGLEPI